MALPTNKKSSRPFAVQRSLARRTAEPGAANGHRRHAHEWHEITDLYHKILEAYYKDEDRRRALRYVPRLEGLLRRHDADHNAILGEECWSLSSELRGDLSAAIKYRRNEIRLIRKLWATLPGSPKIVHEAILADYGPTDLADQYDLLAGLYHDAGQLKKAIKTLWQSRELCELHGIKFDGKDLLRDYLSEYRAKSGPKKVPAGKRN
jgi:tetratricopeptide (TPR) repeat protein